ncbi:MAG: hypothetical protein AAF907_16155, partial [Planctomycetota bacterium]
LRGRLVGVRKRQLTQTITDDPREIELAFALEVTWEDKRGNTLNDGELQINPDSILLLSTGEAAIEVGQSRVTAQRVAVQRLARQVVDLMEVPW